MIDSASRAYRRLLGRWVDGARRHAILVVAAAVLASAAGGYYTANNLGVFTDTADMLSEELPFRQAYIEYKRAFPQYADNIVVVLDGENPDLVERAAARMSARLESRTDLFKGVYDPANDPFFVRNGFLYLSVEELEDVANRLADAQPLLGTLAEDMSLRGLFDVLSLAMDDIAAGDTDPGKLQDVFAAVAETVEARAAGDRHVMAWGALMRGPAADGDAGMRFIVAQPRLDYTSLHPARPGMDAVRAIARDLDLAEQGVRVRLTGGAVLDEEELNSVTEGAALAGTLSVLLVGVLLILGLRSGRLVLATLATLIMGLVWTATFAAVAIGHLNLISVTFAVLFIGLGVDFGIQFCLRYREETARGKDTAAALRDGASGVGGALTLAAAAAAIGFFSFVPTAYVGLSELGVIAGAGMVIALFANLTVLPALIALAPLPPPGDTAPVPAAARPGAGGGGARLVLRRPGLTVGAVLALALGALWLLPSARFDFNPLGLTDPSTESVQTYRDLMEEGSTAAFTIGILADNLDAAARLARRLERLPEVHGAATLTDFVPDRQEEKLRVIEDMAFFLFPVFHPSEGPPPPTAADRRRALADFRDRLDALLAGGEPGALADEARRLDSALDRLVEANGGLRPGPLDAALARLEDDLLATLPWRLERLEAALQAGPVSLEDLPEDVRARAVAEDGRALVLVTPQHDIVDNEALRRFVGAVRAVAPNATDSPVVMLEAGDAVIEAFTRAGIIAVLGITVLLVVVLRSLADALLVLFPLGLAAAFTVAATVLLGIPFNFANVIALPLLFTLGVAFGIYLVLRQRGAPSVAEMLRTNTPRAILFSALTTMGSFGTLALSPHRGTSSMGQLLAISLTLALACTLVVLPALLELKQRRLGRPSGGDS